jgi:hypothetical protein
MDAVSTLLGRFLIALLREPRDVKKLRSAKSYTRFAPCG